jgi:hypothetical protein
MLQDVSTVNAIVVTGSPLPVNKYSMATGALTIMSLQ